MTTTMLRWITRRSADEGRVVADASGAVVLVEATELTVAVDTIEAEVLVPFVVPDVEVAVEMVGPIGVNVLVVVGGV
jgi:hypothetical protein